MAGSCGLSIEGGAANRYLYRRKYPQAALDQFAQIAADLAKTTAV